MSTLGFEVSDDLKPKLQAWADLCDGLWAAWQTFARQLALGSAEGSPFRRDVERFVAAHPDAERLIAYAAGDTGSRVVAAMGQHISALAVLLRSGVVTLSVYPIVRAELELAGAAAWLLDPGTPKKPLGTDPRLARALMFVLADVRDHLRAGPYAKEELIQKLKARETKVRGQIDSVFHGSKLAGSPTRSWSVGGENYPATNAMIDLFTSLAFHPNSPSLYGFYSRFSHPSIITLQSLSKVTYTETTMHVDYHVPSDRIEDWVRLATMSLHKAAHIVAWYFGFETAALDEWVKTAPDSWFDAEAQTS